MSLSRILEEKIKNQFSPITYDLDKYSWDTIAGETVRVYKHLMNINSSCEK
jgi:hypothetical protein